MKKQNFLLALLGLIIFASCKKDDGGSNYTPPRPYNEQYANEIIEIEEYLTTHYLDDSQGIENVSIKEIPDNGSQTPIAAHPDLSHKIVSKHDIEYKLYYIKFNEGIYQRPSHVDSVFVTYKGWLTDGTQFDYRPNPLWLNLDEMIEGFIQVFPEFKTGGYNEIINTFENSGAGLVIIPSGLGYYNSSSNNIPAYSTLVFSFGLNTLRYRDHDRDGIPSYLEVENLGDDPRQYDTDGDGIPNYLDVDDDNDGKITRGEITDENGDIYPFDQIPTCPGGTIKKHLDPSCQ